MLGIAMVGNRDTVFLDEIRYLKYLTGWSIKGEL